MNFVANVNCSGNHYNDNQVVRGSQLKIEGGKIFLFDDEENYINELGDFTRNEWVEVKPTSIVLDRNFTSWEEVNEN